jgi:hypothetical protein
VPHEIWVSDGVDALLAAVPTIQLAMNAKTYGRGELDRMMDLRTERKIWFELRLVDELDERCCTTSLRPSLFGLT